MLHPSARPGTRPLFVIFRGPFHCRVTSIWIFTTTVRLHCCRRRTARGRLQLRLTQPLDPPVTRSFGGEVQRFARSWFAKHCSNLRAHTTTPTVPGTIHTVAMRPYALHGDLSTGPAGATTRGKKVLVLASALNCLHRVHRLLSVSTAKHHGSPTRTRWTEWIVFVIASRIHAQYYISAATKRQTLR